MSSIPLSAASAQGHLVKEIDLLWGVHGLSDRRGWIQFRTLNHPRARRYGPRVRRLIGCYIGRPFADESRTSPIWSSSSKPWTTSCSRHSSCRGRTQLGLRFARKGGRADDRNVPRWADHVGLRKLPRPGRAGDPASHHACDKLREMSLPAGGSLKTGTPPRLERPQHRFFSAGGAAWRRPEPVFSSWGGATCIPGQLPCWIHPYETRATHEIFGGALDGRRCIPRDSGRGSALLPVQRGQDPPLCRQVQPSAVSWPEGFRSNEIYPNGISTACPRRAVEAGAFDPGPRTRAHRAAGLCDRV